MSTESRAKLGKLELPNDQANKLLEVFPEGVIALDLETTGLSPLTDRVIEISAIKLTGQSDNFEIQTFDQLIRPEISIPQLTIDIHGITNFMVAKSPTLEEVLPEFLKFIGDLPLIAHNAQFDVGFLVFGIHKLGLQMPSNYAYCSCRLARQVFKEFAGHGLANLTEELSIKLENHHTALDDAFAGLQVFGKALLKEGLDDKAKKHCARVLKLNDFSKGIDFQIPEHLGSLKNYIAPQTPLMMRYKGGSHGKSFRPIRPVSLLPMPSGNIMYAHCLLSDMYKSFALSKIKEVREMDEKELELYINTGEK